MVTPEVYPPEAAAAGCSASFTYTERPNPWPEYLSAFWWRDYTFSATPANGWKFLRWELSYLEEESGRTPRSGTRTEWSTNPWSAGGTTAEFSETYFSGDTYSRTITQLVAVFEQEATYGDITVMTSADPAAGGTTSPLSETHQYSGSPSTTFTLTATANNGYRFLNWKLNGTVVATTNTTIVTHAFTSSAQTFHYVAEFLQSSGLILHGSGGTILHGSGGSILHSG